MATDTAQPITAAEIRAQFALCVEQSAYMRGLEGVELRARLANFALTLEAMISQAVAAAARNASLIDRLTTVQASLHGGRATLANIGEGRAAK